MQSPISSTSSYISSTDAAAAYGLTNDHIASLCRRKKIEGSLAGGRLWFVDEASLKAYLAKTQEEKMIRHRKLSEQIRKEQSEKTEVESWQMKGSGMALATALLIVGSFYASAVPARDALAEVPWEHMPAAVGTVSADLYNRTFTTAAIAYLDFIDGVGDVQARSYLSLAEGVTSAAAATLGTNETATLQMLPAAVAETSVGGWVDMVTWYTEEYLASLEMAGEASEYFYEAAARSVLALGEGAALSGERILLGTTQSVLDVTYISGAVSEYAYDAAARVALALGDGLARSGERLLSVTAESSLAVAYASGDAAEYFYDALARVSLATGEGLARSSEKLLHDFAVSFVNGVVAIGDAEAYTYGAVLETMSESSNTMGAAIAGTFKSVDASATAVARWYKEGSDRVAHRMLIPAQRSVTQTASVAATYPVSSAAAPAEVCVGAVCVTEEEFLALVQQSQGR